MSDYQGKPAKYLRLLRLLVDGNQPLTDIQSALGVSERTARSYIKSLREDWYCEIDFDRELKRYILRGLGTFNAAGVISSSGKK